MFVVIKNINRIQGEFVLIDLHKAFKVIRLKKTYKYV